MTIRNLDDLVAAICALRDRLGLTDELLDARAGLDPGCTAKLLAPDRGRRSVRGLLAILAALGAGLVLIEDAAAIERVKGRWVRCKRPSTALTVASR